MTTDYNDQRGKVYHAVEKRAMVTFNVPRSYQDGAEFRPTAQAQTFRELVVEQMVMAARTVGIAAKVYEQ